MEPFQQQASLPPDLEIKKVSFYWSGGSVNNIRQGARDKVTDRAYNTPVPGFGYPIGEGRRMGSRI